MCGRRGGGDVADADEEHFPWHYTEFGVLCACGEAMDAEEQCTAREAEPELTAEGLRALLDTDTVADAPMGSVVETETDGESCEWLRCGYAEGTWFPDGGDEDDWADSATVAAYGGRLSAVAVPVGLARQLVAAEGRERAALLRAAEAARVAADTGEISTAAARDLAAWHHPPGAAALVHTLARMLDTARENVARLRRQEEAGRAD